jgi:hypothetical protein
MPVPKLYFDALCELRHLLQPWITEQFYDLRKLTIDPDAIYVFGRKQSMDHAELIRDLAIHRRARLVFANPYEGSETLMMHLKRSDLDTIARQRLIRVISGGELEPEYDYLLYDYFLPQVADYKSNLEAMSRSNEIFCKTHKPYKFLYLNGRARGHRKFMIELMDSMGLLKHCIWSWLDSGNANSQYFRFVRDGQDLMTRPRSLQLLDPYYEVASYRNNMDFEHAGGYAKNHLFNQEWGEIYLNADAYIDTYFSLVTETVCHYPYSFRTEKIWKPVAMGHPWIAVANRGYYRSMRNLGFRTFDPVIDESFDQIDNDQQRLERIVMVVKDLCEQNLEHFLAEVRPICDHNRQHLALMRDSVRQQLPDRFWNWVTQ